MPCKNGPSIGYLTGISVIVKIKHISSIKHALNTNPTLMNREVINDGLTVGMELSQLTFQITDVV